MANLALALTRTRTRTRPRPDPNPDPDPNPNPDLTLTRTLSEPEPDPNLTLTLTLTLTRTRTRGCSREVETQTHGSDGLGGGVDLRRRLPHVHYCYRGVRQYYCYLYLYFYDDDDYPHGLPWGSPARMAVYRQLFALVGGARSGGSSGGRLSQQQVRDAAPQWPGRRRAERGGHAADGDGDGELGEFVAALELAEQRRKAPTTPPRVAQQSSVLGAHCRSRAGSYDRRARC